jgi:hypothetical protein
MDRDLYDPAPDAALDAALAALSPAAEAAVRAVEIAAAEGDWAAALAAIEQLAGQSADALQQAIEAALLAGAARVGQALPPDVLQAARQPQAQPQGLGDVIQRELESLSADLRPLYLAAMGQPAGLIQPQERLPAAEAALRSLQARQLVTADQARQMTSDARNRSLAVAGVVREQALEALRPLLEEQTLAPSLAGFRRRLRESDLADALVGRHIETAFRDAVQTAYADGMDRMLDDPIVGDAFPYIERLPIKDSRLSRVCAWASQAGINGTGIYRRDDPSWRLVRPPTHHNCRCGQSPITKEMAAMRGIVSGRHVTLPDGLLDLLRR